MMRRLPVYLLIDCSESMAGQTIDSVAKGVNSLFQELCSNPYTVEMVYISVITFNRTAVQVSPLTEVTEFRPPKLSIRPGTALGAALRLLQDAIKREVIKTSPTVKGDYRPLVFLLTDGQPTDEWKTIADTIKEMRDPKIANIYAIGCGDDVDYDILHNITDIVLRVEDLSPETVGRFFVWLTASVHSASVNVDNTGIDLTKSVELPQGVEKVLPGAIKKPDDKPRQVFLHALCSKTRKPYLLRFSLHEDRVHYMCVAAHPLEELMEEDSNYLPPINSSSLVGCVPCPHCENPLSAVCSCSAIFCEREERRQTTVCPKCEATLTLGEGGGDFEIKRSEG